MFYTNNGQSLPFLHVFDFAEYRLCKHVDCASVEAIEMPDLCFLYPANTCQVISPTYTFEIKVFKEYY